MHFLTSCLRDRALDCVKNIRVRAENFEIAWDTLKARYNNKRRLINVHISTLLSLPTVPKESALELQIIRDKVNTAVAALKNLQRTPEELWNDILICLVSQKLDSATRKAWNLKFSDERMPPSYKDLSNFPDTRIRALEEWKLPSPSSEKALKSAHAQKISSNAFTKSSINCSSCKAKHYFNVCPQFTSKSPNQRRDLVKQETLFQLFKQKSRS